MKTFIKNPKPKISIKNATVQMIHGAGGRGMQQLIEQIFLKHFANPFLSQLNDQACFNVEKGQMAMSTDTHVITPLFFPGGDIGSLAVHGTINDLAMAGAIPQYLTTGFILEEGLPLVTLNEIVKSMAATAAATNVRIISGDTKVVEKNKADGIFINTTGIGVIPKHVQLTQKIKPGDKIIINGFIGDHGIAVMSKRKNLIFDTQLTSDSCALHNLVANMTTAVPDIHCMRDPTRGGIAATLNEWANQHQVGFKIYENNIPVRDSVRGACELLGIDPLCVANEGKLLVACDSKQASLLLKTMQQHPLGKQAAIIGEAIADEHHLVHMQTSLGGARLVDWLVGEQLPRIC